LHREGQHEMSMDASPSETLTMRYLAYAAGIVFKAAGVLLALTAGIIRLGGRPNSRLFLTTGIVVFAVGFLLKHAAHLKKCHRCLEKMDANAVRCRRCGFDFPASATESISQPFYKK
jgi:hypothetical protein